MSKPVTSKKYNYSSRTVLFSLMTTEIFGFSVMPTTPLPTAVSVMACSDNTKEQIADFAFEDTTEGSRHQVLLQTLQTSLETLSDAETVVQVDSVAQFLKDSMSISCRKYHRLPHVLYVALYQEDPIYQLAGLFHDVIYTSIDKDEKDEESVLCPQQAALLKDVVTANGAPNVERNSSENDVHLQLVLQIFGIDAPSLSNTIVPPGWDECLSALTAVRLLAPYMSMAQLVQIVVCIEATIPFRPPSAMDALHTRLQDVNRDFKLGLSPQECIQAIERAATMANRDVNNFAYQNAALFLDKTWMLLSELNRPLRSQTFTALQYQHAISKMHGFFVHFLNPLYIFKSYGQVSGEGRTRQACINVEIAKKYLSAKLLSASVVAAVTILIKCQDQPLKTLLGNDWTSMPAPTTKGHPIDKVVYKILYEGRAAEAEFDIRESPLAALLYGTLGDDALQRLLPNAYPMDSTQKAIRLLKVLPRNLVHVMLDCLAEIGPTQKQLVIKQLDMEEDRIGQTKKRGADDL